MFRDLPFNSQPHTRLTLLSTLPLSTPDNFQFTASYEADRISDASENIGKTFNSQPHTRLTDSIKTDIDISEPFNSQPHTRLTYAVTQIPH